MTAWGYGVFGQSDVPLSLDGRTVPRSHAGNLHNLVLTSDAQVVVWGLDGDGQSDVPASLACKRVTAISAGGSLSLAVTAGVSPVLSKLPKSTQVEVGAEAPFAAGRDRRLVDRR